MKKCRPQRKTYIYLSICLSICLSIYLPTYLSICLSIYWVRPNSCNNQIADFFTFWAKVVLSVFLRANNRAFRCFPSCKKLCSRSCFLVLSFVHKIVLFGAPPRARAFWCSPPRAKNRALDRAFWCSPSCQKSCFLVLSFVHSSPLSKHRALDGVFWCSPSWTNSVVFVVVPRAKNRAFWCSPSCQKPCSRSCFLVLPFVHKIVLFGALLRATNRAFWCFPSCHKSLSLVPKIVL